MSLILTLLRFYGSRNIMRVLIMHDFLVNHLLSAYIEQGKIALAVSRAK